MTHLAQQPVRGAGSNCIKLQSRIRREPGLALAGTWGSGEIVLNQKLNLARQRQWPGPSLALALPVLLSGLFLLLTLRPGQPWDGDAELYIRGALNILDGSAYAQSHYVINPVEPHHPGSMPPGLPLMLVPLVALFGINYLAIKIELILCFIALLGLLALNARQSLSQVQCAIFILALGFNPFIWGFKDVVYSEFAFMLSAYACLLAIDRLDRQIRYRPLGGYPLPDIGLIALLLASSLAIRTAGIALIAALLVQSLFRNRRYAMSAIAASILALGLHATLTYLLPADIGTYASPLDIWRQGSLSDDLRLIQTNISLYALASIDLIQGLDTDFWPFGWLVLAGMGLIIFRIALLAFQQQQIFDLFVGASLAMLILFPIAQEPARYALPLLPIFLWRLIEPFDGRPLWGLCLLLGLIYGHGYWQRPPDDGLSVDRHEARALYRAIADIVPADDLIIASHPTVIGLYAKRRSTSPSTHMSVDDFWQMVGQHNAKWLVANTPPLLDPLRPIQPALAERMKVAYENPAFTLYRLNQHQDQGHSPDGVDQKPSSSSF